MDRPSGPKKMNEVKKGTKLEGILRRVHCTTGVLVRPDLDK